MALDYTGPKRVLSVFALVMINVVAVGSLRSLPIGAQYGVALLFFYLIAALTFFIPIALITAELATGWPQTGGIYVWVREAFGERIGFLTISLQWIYNVVWYPTLLAFLATAIAYLIDPSLSQNKIYMLTMILVLFWSATIINCFGMRLSSWISALGAVVGNIIPMVLITVLGTLWFLQGKSTHIESSWHALLPKQLDFQNIAFFSGVLFGLMGLEMSAVHAEEVKNPVRDYPKALLYSGVLIWVMLAFASLALAFVVPSQQLNLVSGVIDAFAIFFNSYHWQWMIPVIVLMIILSGVGCLAAWIIGSAKGLYAAAKRGMLPELFTRINSKASPYPILIMQAVVVTLLCAAFSLFETVSEVYWVLTALTAQLALLLYVILFATAYRLRRSHAHVERAYRVPISDRGMGFLCATGALTSIIGIATGFVPPNTIALHERNLYVATLVAGMLLMCIPPLLVKRKNK